MKDIELKKFSPINPVLKKLIKYYWMIKSNKEVFIHGKLIPVNNIDLLINLSTSIQYTNRSIKESFENSHFNGIYNNYRHIEQTGVLDVVGISFFPTGFYPLIKVPLSEFANNTVLIDDIIHGFERKVERIAAIESGHQRISLIEDTLLDIIDFKLLPDRYYDSLINEFLLHGGSVNVADFCKAHTVNQRTLERFFNKYVGTTPKGFLKTTKFQKTMNRLIMGDFDSMTQVGYEYDYYDQTHFINSFKSFMGRTPVKQLKENDLIIDSLRKG